MTGKEPEQQAATKSPRKMTAYNLYMKTQVPKVKTENPELSHKEAFKLAASSWSTSPDNPKNKATA
ncbi:hypothetical protein BCR43DRAFT_524632 [Syncephalastrum racemosum]|uniref:YABBY protein C-terminal domain-containing protein n=1 Tax=Syncephalastrum racemosum TaxID=13706 RepID=A0A1X2HCR4_SYNRA|nr:hypothetical protein BCR43DRAFT_524632 [Syncephalastrum racemosum]